MSDDCLELIMTTDQLSTLQQLRFIIMNLVNGNSQILVILDLFLNPNKVWKLGPVQFRPGVPGDGTRKPGGRTRPRGDRHGIQRDSDALTAECTVGAPVSAEPYLGTSQEL